MGIVVCCCRWNETDSWVLLSDAAAEGSRDLSLFPPLMGARPLGIVICCHCLEKLGTWGLCLLHPLGQYVLMGIII